ncbi:PAS domain-containing sensor histidine kinase [Nonlabens ponticola]|uniref:histidine kinase n=1 Tax=Nonlabens ponticola TaxID=2496866 RepID=A0A3S9MYW5_9FLAO|nr:PAS domain-containing sensor histidine kinase [Nonlabens ponticola]AZQ44339.1 PAS domain S-box protein [Nonlabens ponticola]
MSVSQQKDNAQQGLNTIKGLFEHDHELSFKVFQHMPIGICVTNANGHFTDVNATYCDIYGYTREELIGNPFTMVVPDESQDQLVNLHERFLKDEYELTGRWTVYGKSKEKFEIITNAAFLKEYDTENDEEDIRKMTLVVRADELHRTIARLETSIEILERKLETQDLAHRLAEHDMRNRLATIVSVADILAKTDVDEKQMKWIETIKHIGIDTLQLLTSAKDYADMERGDYEPKIEEFDLIQSLETMTKDYKDLINRKKLKLTMKLDGEEVIPGETSLRIKADKFYLDHLFQNLLSNAIEASPKKERIKIKLNTDDVLLVHITNKGNIPKDVRENFFSKYVTSGKERGTGLGTYIAKMIAELHEGDITFITGNKKGTTITVRLPIKIVSKGEK